ncbi:LolA family protein [Maricaulis parjimensis]|uniref:LolA family protein n=1 Tax=Maricaulis parjimensis TaxID=144023 RepID=UPI00193993E1|nr:outer membrane lipoprotein carrier protein LolA [Maricaulis parjimensis]
MMSLLVSLAIFAQTASEPPAQADEAELSQPAAESAADPVTETAIEPPAAEIDREAMLEQLNTYLNGIGTLRARFSQIAPDGSLATGVLSLQRPGRLRFQYDDPSPIRVIADGTTVAIEDQALETVDRIPLRSTPVWWLLKDEINLSEDAEIAGMAREYGFFYLTLRDPSGEMEGEIMFVFAEPSLELREWYVTDALGEITRVSLNDVETGMRLDPRLFRIPEPEDRRDSRRGR